MKLFNAVAVSAVLFGSASAFTFRPSVKKVSSLSMATTIDKFGGKHDGYSDKPLYTPKSTTPEPVRKVSWFQKQSLPDVIIEPSFFLTYAVALLGPLILWYHPCKFVDRVCAIVLLIHPIGYA